MPLFEFMCNKCGEMFEILVFGNETAECPKCKSKNVTKQFSSFSAMSASSNCSLGDSCSAATKHKHKCCGGCCHPS